MRPPPPERLIQHGLNRANADAVHTGECWAAAESGRCRPVTRQQALEALQQQVPASTADRTRPSVSSTRRFRLDQRADQRKMPAMWSPAR
ncbi:DUF6233 domain-containing protein [Streptomyces sp. NPDC005890]|uniref:DUF6233 domain-containing protein n=1 Tax=Streptomyces sp. NPDC005890 TaxID=3154568 RepID=UPI003402EF2B